MTVQTADQKPPSGGFNIYDPKVRGILYQVAARRGSGLPRLHGRTLRRGQHGAAEYPAELRFPQPDGRFRDQSDAGALLGCVELRPGLSGRPAEHAAGQRRRYRLRDHHRLRRRSLTLVAELDRFSDRDRLRRIVPQHPAAAAIGLLVQCRPEVSAGAAAVALRLRPGLPQHARHHPAEAGLRRRRRDRGTRPPDRARPGFRLPHLREASAGRDGPAISGRPRGSRLDRRIAADRLSDPRTPHHLRCAQLKGFNFVGGAPVFPEFAALLLGCRSIPAPSSPRSCDPGSWPWAVGSTRRRVRSASAPT